VPLHLETTDGAVALAALEHAAPAAPPSPASRRASLEQRILEGLEATAAPLRMRVAR
jgi:hypothetical protein